ncbi:MAG: HAD family hydrolase [Chitinophagaceae bacterium]|nr:HAD family hydrolase [Chitinophagaceae bacterium]
MLKKAIILDLDNTIYPVSSIGDEVFSSLFDLIESDGSHLDKLDEIKKQMMRRPFQMVASDYGFSEDLKKKGARLLADLRYEGALHPFNDYQFVKELSLDRFLVTTGFYKLQRSKVDGMKIGDDFKEVHIIDPSTSSQTKRDVFASILSKHGYLKDEVLVVGDDLHSEIQAAKDLGIPALLYNKLKLTDEKPTVPAIESFQELKEFLE